MSRAGTSTGRAAPRSPPSASTPGGGKAPLPAVAPDVPPDPQIELESESEADPRADSSLARMLSVLSLFSTDTPALTVDEIATRLQVPKSTGYRYIQELCKVGLLVRLDRSITLGPRVIELDRCIREADPVIRAAAPPMRRLSEQTGLDVFISKLYGHSIITVHMEHHEGLRPPYGYGRGRPMPLSRGSSSKALVSFLPAARLRRLHQEMVPDPAHGSPGWESFYGEAQKIRAQGWCRTSGELNPGMTGVSAPVFGRNRLVVASITALGTDERFRLFDSGAIADLVVRTAQAIGSRLSSDEHP